MDKCFIERGRDAMNRPILWPVAVAGFAAPGNDAVVRPPLKECSYHIKGEAWPS